MAEDDLCEYFLSPCLLPIVANVIDRFLLAELYESSNTPHLGFAN